MKYLEIKLLTILLIINVLTFTREANVKRNLIINKPSSFIATDDLADDFGDFNMDDLILNDKKPSVKTLNSNDKSLTNKVKNNVPPKVVLNRKVTKLKITSNYPKKVAPKIKQKEKQIPKKKPNFSFKEKFSNKIKNSLKNEKSKIQNKNLITKTEVKKEIDINQDESKNLISKIDTGFLNDLIKLQTNPFFSNLSSLLTSNSDFLSKNTNFNSFEKNQNLREKIEKDRISNVFSSKIVDPDNIKSLYNEIDKV